MYPLCGLQVAGCQTNTLHAPCVHRNETQISLFPLIQSQPKSDECTPDHFVQREASMSSFSVMQLLLIPLFLLCFRSNKESNCMFFLLSCFWMDKLLNRRETKRAQQRNCPSFADLCTQTDYLHTCLNSKKEDLSFF